MLTDTQRALWDKYLVAEGQAPREKKLEALHAFLETLQSSSPVDWYPWARELARQVVDAKIDFVIRTPLFERSVLPALLAGYRERLPGCARWLAGLQGQVIRSPRIQELLTEEC